MWENLHEGLAILPNGAQSGLNPVLFLAYMTLGTVPQSVRERSGNFIFTVSEEWSPLKNFSVVWQHLQSFFLASLLKSFFSVFSLKSRNHLIRIYTWLMNYRLPRLVTGIPGKDVRGSYWTTWSCFIMENECTPDRFCLTRCDVIKYNDVTSGNKLNKNLSSAKSAEFVCH